MAPHLQCIAMWDNPGASEPTAPYTSRSQGTPNATRRGTPSSASADAARASAVRRRDAVATAARP